MYEVGCLLQSRVSCIYIGSVEVKSWLLPTSMEHAYGPECYSNSNPGKHIAITDTDMLVISVQGNKYH